MTIKEIETLTGMTRANIRFYESQGLLHPARGANGYRDYSEEDVQLLKRIQLLRSLHMSLEDIRNLQTDREELTTALDRQIGLLEQERTEADRSRQVCREMRQDGASFHTLDAQRYLDSLDRPRSETVRILQTDVESRDQIPFRRYFARTLDLWIDTTVVYVFLMVVCNVRVMDQGALVTLALPVLLMVILEPLLLSRTGTTLGKWILGISVTDLSGERMDYWEALTRTCSALWKGAGFYIPVYSLVRLWKMYSVAAENRELPWEEESRIVRKDFRAWRIPAYLAAAAILVGVLVGGTVLAESPRHRGDLTAEEFSENFNRLAGYYRMDFGRKLDSNGHWGNRVTDTIGITIADPAVYPDFVLEETDGKLTAVSFTYDTAEDFGWPLSTQNQVLIAVLSFACAQSGYGAFSDARTELLELIDDHPNSSYRFSEHGVTTECVVESEGYVKDTVGNALWTIDGAETYYSISFRISLEA